MEKIRILIDKLNYYTKLYDEGHPIISDKEWDDMYFELVNLELETGIIYPDSPSQSIYYEEVSRLEKVEHNHPMLSLSKTKSIEEVESFGKSKQLIAMSKLDGLTCSLRYQNGKLISAETRGNGIVGENILHNAKVVKNIPQTINYLNELIIDGEIICTYEDFKPYKEVYKNPRNFASGSIRLLDAEESKKRNLSFIAWDVITGLNALTLGEKLGILDEIGFTSVPYRVLDEDVTIQDAIDIIQIMSHELGFPIDGVVFKYNDCKYYASLGATDHHFRGGLAYKFYDEEYETSLKDIEWTMGRTSVLTPVAVFEPIETDDSVIERASLHNWTVMHETIGTPYRGQKIYVYKANAIIPQIARGEIKKPTEEEVDYIARPSVCPICGGDTKLEESDSGTINLICLNPQCSGKLINQIDYFVGKKGLDIKGLSKATIEKLIDWDWLNNKSDIFNLYTHREEWIKKPGFGIMSVDKLLSAIETSKDIKLESFISSLGIPFIGTVLSKVIVSHVNTYDEFRSLIKEKYNFMQWEGFAEAKCAALLNYDYTEADKIAKIIRIKEVETINKENNSLELIGKVFVITGKLINFKNRDILKKEIESRGGKVTDSVSSKTTCLINNDSTSSSSKNKKANELKIPILSEEEFIKNYF